MTSNYRADIDCLRALAVLSVFAFHLEIKRFGGGFVGVDIFFVISGYLISRIIMEEISEGAFSFAAFYERRVRRILPALYGMLGLTAAVAWVVLLRGEFEDFLKSLLATVGLSSNIWFWLNTGYFDIRASEKLLLHTWSLSVEEQFYLVFPLVVWLLTRTFRKPVLAIEGVAPQARQSYPLLAVGAAAAATLLFFWASQLMLDRAPEAAFYLAPSRAGEFLIGTLLVLIRPYAPLTRQVQAAMALAGMALMLFAILRFRAINPFPGWRAAVPCLGAALVIHAFGKVPMGGSNWIVTRIGLFFGRISYSLYLWHWPVILFARLLFTDPAGLTPADRLGIFAASFLLALASYHCIEQPFRRRRIMAGRRQIFMTATFASLALGLVALAGLTTRGIQRPVDQLTASLLRYDASVISKTFTEANCFMLPSQTHEVLLQAGCLQKADGKKNILLWGDSAAAHYSKALSGLLNDSGIRLLQMTSSACAPHSRTNSAFTKPYCQSLNEYVRSKLADMNLDGIILSANWRNHSHSKYFGFEFSNLLADLAVLRIPVIVIGPPVEVYQDLPGFLARKHLLGLTHDNQDNVQRMSFETDAALRALTLAHGVPYVSILDSLCPKKVCDLYADAQTPLVWDQFHLTPEGASKVIGAIRTGLLAGLKIQ